VNRLTPLRSLVRAALVVACAALVLGGPAQAAATSVETEHYTFVTEGPEAEARELTRVLEAAWPELTEFFVTAPKLAKGERLTVRFFETQAAMKAAIVAGGGAAPDSGGYYCPVAKAAYAFRQPSRWYTRTLVLHEATHQFHRLGAALGATPPAWWEEGLAEHLSSHTWDGRTLRLGVVPPVSLEDRSGAVWKSVHTDYPVEGIPGEQPLDRPRAMHLVRFLAAGDAGKPFPAWKDLRKTLDRGGAVKSRDLWKPYGKAPLFRERFVHWLPTVLQPFVSEFIEWDSLRDDAVRGTGAVVAICRTRAPAASIEATVAPADPSKPWRAGLLLAWRGADDYVIAQLVSGGNGDSGAVAVPSVRVDRRLAGAWQTLFDGPLPPGAAAPWKLSVERRGSEAAFRIGGADAAVVAVPQGPLGLCLDACTADFTSIRAR